MPNTREKLIELLGGVQHISFPQMGKEMVADHLIANGVVIQSDCQACAKATSEVIANLQKRFATDNNFGDKISPAAYKLSATDKDNNVPSKWIPVTERLPEEDGRYLVVKTIFNNSIYQDVSSFAKDGRKVDKYDFYRGWKNVWYYYDSEWGHITTGNVTHWMPLPEPPKGE